MTRILYRRDSRFMRFVSTLVALSFTLSLAGSGFAAPTSTGSSETPVTEATLSSDATATAPGDGEVSGTTPEAEPAAPEVTAEGETAPIAAPSKRSKTVKSAPAAPVPTAGVSASRASAQAGAGDISIVDFQGYHLGQLKWTNGNLGKEYVEGDWVPYRLVLKNTGTAPVAVTDIGIGLDHFDSNPNAAVMFDRTRSWGYALTGTQPASGDSKNAPAGFVGITPAAQDVPEGAAFGAAPTIRTDIAAGAFTIAPDEYAIVYFQGHLALTAEWNYRQPGTDGAGGYPGSSGHGYLEMTAGARTLPLPSVLTPAGTIKVIKYYDTDQDGQKDAGETQLLSGWEMKLHGENGFTIDLSKLTDANGEAVFSLLPPGDYAVSETLKPGWASKTAQPIAVTLVDGEVQTVYIGNYRPDVTKTWSLSIDNLPAGAVPFVTYKVNGEARSTNLSGSGPYTASVTVPYGAAITEIKWYVSFGGENLLLGTSANETLTGDKTNSFDYDSAVCGTKFSDNDGNGLRGLTEAGLPGWTIQLKRVSGGVETLYAQTVTGVGGTYTFTDVLPGTYAVYEVQQAGYFQTASPSGTFTVGNDITRSNLDFGNMPVFSSVDIVKGGPAAVHVGDTITYTFTVTNTGNNTLTNVAVTDPSIWITAHVVGTLAPGASATFTATRLAPANPDPLPNTAVVTGNDVLGALVTDSDSHLIDIIKPAITVTKSADHDKVVYGTDVLYTYVVTNSGEDTLTGVSLTDDKTVVAGGTIGTLAPGASVTLTALVPLSVTTTNVATAAGTDILGLEVTDTAVENVEVYNPSISIVKSADPKVILEGELVTYTYLVTNTGDITLNNIAVTDDKLGFINNIASLAPGAFATVSVTAPISADVTNIGTATGFYGVPETDFFGSVTDSSSEDVDVVHPAIDVEKTASRSAILPGETVTYTYVVTNTGDVTLYGVSVDDDKLGNVGAIAVLAVGESRTFTSSKALTESTTNIVLATATDAVGHPVSDQDSATVPVFNPSINIVKTGAPSPILSGATVTYTYVVTNTGDIALHDVEVTDDKLGTIGTISDLAIGASATLTKSTAITADTTNVGTATGRYGTVETDFSGTVTDDDDAFIDVIAPAVQVVKSASPSAIVSGDSVTYTFVVTNTGDVKLINLSVDDDKLGHIGDISSLAVGESATLTKSTTLAATTTNVVTVTGTDENENPVSDTDDETVPVYNPSIQIVKTAAPGTVLAGGNVTYTYAVTNDGDIALHDVVVTDDKLGPVGIIASLGIGATEYLTASAPITGDVTNIGTATGEYGAAESDFFGTVTDSDDAFVDVIHPSILVEKSASASPILSGGAVTYTFVVTNTGDVPLVNVSVDDDKLGHIGDVASLAVGASSTLTKATTLSATTTNIVTATATDELGNPVSDTDNETVEVFSPAISLIKSANPTVILSGETVTYTYVVENTGDIWLHDITVTDDKLGAIGNIASLDPGQSATLTASAPIAADVVNIGTATGVYGTVESQFGGTVSDTDDAAVNVVNPAIDVAKSASPDAILTGESVVYTYTVTNTGDVDLFNVNLTDDKLGAVGQLESLAVGASSTFTATTTLSLPTTNTVVAVGTDEFGHQVSDEALAFVDVAAPFSPPDVTIDKSADKTVAKAGDTVRYTLTYRNLGPGVARDMTIVDDFDERYVTITDAAGGTVADGKITWSDAGPLNPEDGPKTITYTVKINSNLPADVRVVRNTVVISEPREENTSNNSDTWRVDIDEPFLPFTGGAWIILAFAAMAFGALGTMLRRFARVAVRS